MSNIHIFLLIITPFYPVLATPPRHCTCVHFNSTGTFHSPNYPNQITNIDCVFYHFEGPENHLVQIVFHGFLFPPRHERCEQSLRIYDHSRDGMIGVHQNPDFEFCGKEIAPGHVFYSRDNHFILQILHSQASSKGFMGEYRFLPKKNFSSDAVQLSEYSYRVEKAKGTLYSPSYPYFYPTRVNATFIVPQRKGHQVVLSSSELLLGDEAVLYVFDMTNGETLLQTVTSTSHKFFCTSSSPLLLSFVAGHNEVERARGLVIEFLYEPARWPLAADPQVDGECLVTITSEREKSGNFSSKKWNWKGGSNLPTKCRLLFQGFPGERVSVKFVYFNLYVPDNKNVTERCGDVDSLTADVRVGSRLSRVAEWCANQLPPPLMSNTNLLQIEYTTKSSRAVRDSARLEHGFALEYLFHNDWNMKHMQAKVDTNKACRFIFNSSLQSSGKLWSVNYPGFYPRNLYCEYIFHGSEDQIVHIHFEYFDVEGFNQCDETTQSDFVLFSNYQTHDRTNRRFCGKVAPRGPILSESNYFRMIFFTNDIFDATGFYAHYQFITQQKAQISRVKLTTTSVCDPLSWNFSYLLFLVSLIL